MVTTNSQEVVRNQIIVCTHCKELLLDENNHECDKQKEFIQWQVDHLKRMGYTKGWLPNESIKKYGTKVLGCIEDISKEDWEFLSEQIDMLTMLGCKTGITVCKAFNYIAEDGDDYPTVEYVEQISQWLKHSTVVSTPVTNEVTGNKFYIGVCN